ncbi:hypothetical protein RHSIM_Rhsim01G0099300 [Rhododendron simsii]|uniref:Disease resistance R13L4/SHOC-2-like LRR domain-containing protein n=1 Tax=Rhododendron simsii TaxID=118357 RepID=A0A834HH20_RHOSS|nr:hypothetical protein RHSIM_Rhsim01G0099300 [Rhododendron simsii]
MDSIGLSLTPVQASSCLTELYLKDCNLSCLSEEIGNLISLRTLDLTENNLSTLPDGICNLTCLKHLLLEENNVSNLPSGIGRLTSLESLYLSRNSLCTLPDTIGKLSCLKDLWVGNNKLSHLPSEIGDLDSLKTLVLEGNNGFRALPESIGHLPYLIDLSLNNCAKLRSFPKLPTCRYRYVDAVCCPSLESLPLELDQLGWRANYSGSNKLAENNYLTSLLNQLPKSKGLSKLKDAVNITVPAGEEELRIWFPYHDVRGPNVVSFVVPPSPFVNQKMLGWILRLVLGAPRETSWVLIRNVIRNKIRWFDVAYPFYVYPTDVDHVCLIYIPQGYRGLQLEGGDEVEIPMSQKGADYVEIPIDVTHPNTLVKKWAIDLIYEADEIHKGNDTWCQVEYNIQL